MSGVEKFHSIDSVDIAIIGVSGRFPGAHNIKQFWQNLRNGVESVSFFSDQELESAGVEPAILSDPNYVKAKPILENIDLFDASFFNISPSEAEVMDPQHRIFLECAWEALESAGYNSQIYSGSIAVYAGSAINQYLLNIYSNRDIIESV
ncbi:MAG: beta-ketoacyl synthase N-terminal-like domain-containing protein, partial [Rhizonema sp. PD38]|nr:beta-ketoacyl synthase N-terminal-like domain-containing protein [Rhizonema sp. PD38]